MKTRRSTAPFSALALCAVLLAPAVHAQDAVLAQKADLLDTPAPKAAAIAKLPESTPLTVLERKGGWYRVRAPGGEEGWVKLLAVRLTARPGAVQEGGQGASGDTAGAALSGAQGGGAAGAAAGAIGSMVTGSAADSTAVRGGSSGKLSGKRMVDPATAGEGGALGEIESFEPSEADMEEFEKGLEEGGQ